MAYPNLRRFSLSAVWEDGNLSFDANRPQSLGMGALLGIVQLIRIVSIRTGESRPTNLAF